ncbi:MAG: bifunctional 4'-phosphopantothenoylcysteine decarboxylase/phosphopantothenoylcysteine synthetase, partial [Chloroflexota bacterium]
PRDQRLSKIKKSQHDEPLVLELERNPDILASVAHPRLIKIGFAAETERLVEHAREKLKAKGLAMIIANDAATTIGSRTSQATLITADGTIEPLPTLPKDELAEIIVSRIVKLLAAQTHASPG